MVVNSVRCRDLPLSDAAEQNWVAKVMLTDGLAGFGLGGLPGQPMLPAIATLPCQRVLVTTMCLGGGIWVV